MDLPMMDMFRVFPHESAAVMQRAIEIGIVCSSILVIHCTSLVLQFWPSDEYPDGVLLRLCLVRVVCAIPRPYFWSRMRKLFMEARHQPTPQLVTQRLLDINARPVSLERVLVVFYYVWLLGITAIIVVLRFQSEQTTDFTNLLGRHCLLNFISIMFHRILCVFLFYYLMQSDLKRGISHSVLEKYTKLLVHTERGREQLGGYDTECSICFGPYAQGEEIRKLPCSHHFHRRCVDVWLFKYQNRCPLCLTVVGPRQEAEKKLDPRPPALPG